MPGEIGESLLGVLELKFFMHLLQIFQIHTNLPIIKSFSIHNLFVLYCRVYLDAVEYILVFDFVILECN